MGYRMYFAKAKKGEKLVLTVNYGNTSLLERNKKAIKNIFEYDLLFLGY